jgi:tetratricopeptide (TPR) repeat protein
MTAALVLAMAGALVAAAPARHPAAEAPSARELFDRGRTAFGRAEYKRAIQILKPLLYPEVVLDSEGEVVQAHRMLGVAYLYENQPDDARREFHKLLELRPDYRFDPLLDPQQVVDAFNAVVKEEEAEIAFIEARRARREQELAARRQRESRLHPPVAQIVRYERHSYVVALVPFGAGQFQNGQRRKGWLFLGTEAGLAAVSVGALAVNFALYGVAPHRKCEVSEPIDANGLPEPCPASEIDHSAENTSRALERVQLVSGGLFFLAAIWGVVDAVRHFQSDVPLGEPGPPPISSNFQLGVTAFGAGATLRF